MTDRHLPADRSDRPSSWWLWLLILVILLAAWYWLDWPDGGPAPAPPVEIGSPAERAADADRIERPGREPRRLDRSESERPDTDSDTTPAATPGEPPVPLSPRS